MVSLQQNSKVLQQAFASFQARGRQNTLDGYRNALSCTNEVTGFDYRCWNCTYYIVPRFINGQDTAEGIKQIAGEFYSKKILEAKPTTRCGVSFNIRNYWANDHFAALYNIDHDHPEKIIEQMWLLAEDLLKHAPKNMTMVCGPISPTNTLSKEDNVRIFHLTMLKLAKEGRNVFNQLPFEPALEQAEDLLNTTHQHLLAGRTTSQFFTDNFYQKIIRSKKNWNPCFIHGSQQSIGATLQQALFIKRKWHPELLPKRYHAFVS